jgi:hypothetical protein
VNPHQLAVITLTVIGFPACTVMGIVAQPLFF